MDLTTKFSSFMRQLFLKLSFLCRPFSLFMAASVFLCSGCERSAHAEETRLDSSSKTGWSRVALSNDELSSRGIKSAAGAQYYRSLAVASSDGDFMLWGTDVGGLFRSLDGGRNWEPINVGYHSRGASAMAVDPHVEERVVAVGTNSAAHPFNGIYLSTNKGASWTEVYPFDHSANADIGRTALVFDPSSFDVGTNRTQVVYWSHLAEDSVLFGEPESFEGGLLRSLDGGETWSPIEGSEIVAASFLSIHPRTGYLLAAGPKGVFRSATRGETWEKTADFSATGLSRSRVKPEEIWASSAQSLWRSTDDGLSWAPVVFPEAYFHRPEAELHNITVAPSDPDRLVVGLRAPNYEYKRFYSPDGGQTWLRSQLKRGDNLVPTNSRPAAFAFDPEDASIILAPGGDFPAISRDGGQTYERAGTGVSNLLVGSTFNFSTTTPGVVLLASQDYGALLTTDGGQSWRYASPGGHSWGGFNYAGYSPDGEVCILGDSSGWTTPRRLFISHDGMQRWENTGKIYTSGPSVSYGAPGSADVLFAGAYRSTDRGMTWKEMAGATHVLTHDPESGALYGIFRSPYKGVLDAIVRSGDDGANWEVVTRAEGRLSDMAYDPSRERLYLVENNRLRIWENGAYLPNPVLPEDQVGAVRVRSVALDPQRPSRVFVAANRDVFNSTAGALYSPDAGETWINLNPTEALAPSQFDGGREPHWVRVNPATGAAWFASSCYGVWRWLPHDLAQAAPGAAEVSD